MVSTAAALPVKAEWVARRPKAKSKPRSERSAENAASVIDPRTWPSLWQDYYVGLQAAQIKPSSFRRYRASVNRCAQLVNEGVATAELNFLNAYRLSEALKTDRRKGRDPATLRPFTVANYIEGLIALGSFGGADTEALGGVRFMRDHLRSDATAGDKLKFERIRLIMERGGFEFIAETVGRIRSIAAALPDHAAEKTYALQEAALCAVSMNKPGRTGDVSSWIIGRDLTRSASGVWELAWLQQKNGRETEAGALWPEVSEILDELILGGRPDRFIHLRYRELIGKNWLTLTDEKRASKWPSSTVQRAIGVPLHDLRTLSADYLRLHDPARAADIIATHLGHASQAAGVDYRATADGDAAARAWAEIRARIAAW